MPEKLGDPAELADTLDTLEAQTGGESLTPSSTGVMGRLMSTTPDEHIDDVEPWQVRGKEYALRYGKRGVGKFTGAGGTALEDIIMAGVNGFAYLWGKLTTEAVEDTPEESDREITDVFDN